MDFEEVLKRRRSVRKFQDRQIRQETLIQILNEARLAPSWANAQDCKVYIATKECTRRIRRDFMEMSLKDPGLSDYSFTHRDDWTDREKRAMKEFEREIGSFIGEDYSEFISVQNTLFDAPCIAYLTLPQDTYKWARSDLGAFEMMLLLCAANRDIHSVVAQAFVKYPEIIRKHLEIPETEEIIIGIGLGYVDDADRINSFRSPRKSLSTIMTIKE